jgi:pyridoxal phosphate enzyme (YggS family)
MINNLLAFKVIVKSSPYTVSYRFFGKNRFLKMSSSSSSSLVHNIEVVRDRINEASQSVSRNPSTVRLVAVSKTKPAEDILTLYREAGQRHFGENYYQELSEKAPQLPADIQWHFIGHLQSSKANKLIKEIPNLYMVETVDTEKLADKLNNACVAADRVTPLNIFIQVDTSNEDTKSGVNGETELLPLVDYIKTNCPKLDFKGLMTIGAPGDMSCFDKLVAYREQVATQLGVLSETLELSMGMSSDYEEAIQKGATNVRVGSTIFGERIYPNKK